MDSDPGWNAKFLTGGLWRNIRYSSLLYRSGYGLSKARGIPGQDRTRAAVRGNETRIERGPITLTFQRTHILFIASSEFSKRKSGHSSNLGIIQIFFHPRSRVPRTVPEASLHTSSQGGFDSERCCRLF